MGHRWQTCLDNCTSLGSSQGIQRARDRQPSFVLIVWFVSTTLPLTWIHTRLARKKSVRRTLWSNWCHDMSCKENAVQESEDHITTDSNWRKSGTNAECGCVTNIREWPTLEGGNATIGYHIGQPNEQDGSVILACCRLLKRKTQQIKDQTDSPLSCKIQDHWWQHRNNHRSETANMISQKTVTLVTDNIY